MKKNFSAQRFTLIGVFVCLALAVFFVVALAQERQKGRISGQVTDEAGTPLADVKIVVARAENRFEAITSNKGRFAIIGLGSGMWRVSAEKEGYDPVFRDTEIFQLKTNPPVELVMKKSQVNDAGTGVPLIDRGNEAMAKGDLDEALAAYREFQAKFPDIYGVRINIAAALLKKNDTAGAEAEYKGVLADVLRVHGDYKQDKKIAVGALSGLGDLAIRRNDLETGRKYFTEALAISPDDEAAAFNVGEILFSSQNIDEAINFYNMAASIKKDWPKPYLKLGYVYLNKGDYDKSIENFNKFIALDPANPEAARIKELVVAVEKMKK